MRTVLGRTAGRASLILVTAGMVGSAALPAVPAAAGAVTHRPTAVSTATTHHPAPAGHGPRAAPQTGTAVKNARQSDATVRQVRG
jgi:hypothetical protein